MTRQELLQAIRDNWFSSDEDLVDFIFDVLPEIKNRKSPVIYCGECAYNVKLEKGINVCTLGGLGSGHTHPLAFCSRAKKTEELPYSTDDVRPYVITKEAHDIISELAEGNHKLFIGGDEE